MIGFLRRANKEGRMSEKMWGEGRGLVFTAGNADTFSRVLLTLKLLHKHLNSPLPSEIFSFPGEVPDEEVRKELESFGAKLRVVEDAVRDGKRTKNYHIKATAIIRSRFREVLYLDSDNMPTGGLGPAVPKPKGLNTTAVEEKWSDPAGLWESKAYKRLGVMFWPDYWRTSADNPIWSIIGVPCRSFIVSIAGALTDSSMVGRDEWEQEAGQIIIDKSQHLDGLLLSEWMMDSSRFKFWFNFSDGDKDMFRYSFLALRKRWAVPGMSGFCGHTMLQADHVGRPLFVHANLLKQIPSGVGKGYAWGRSRTMRNFKSTFEHQGDEPEDADLEDLDVGLQPFFHGGWISALCIDMRWNDPRTDEELASARVAVAGPDPLPEGEEVDISFTSSNDGLEILWRDPLEVVNWGDDVRLREFEEGFFAEGGHLNGAGF
ncbi:hypothetical protein RQP46_008915 [Phenoliferia psychrophenolica]